MLFTENQTIKELLIQELSYSPHLTLEKIIERITPKLKQKITIQGWYKALKTLMAQGVVIKEKKRLVLNSEYFFEDNIYFCRKHPIFFPLTEYFLEWFTHCGELICF